MKISIVISTFNRNDLLLRTINTIKKSKFTDYEIVVVDDASDIPFESDFDKLRIIRLEKNTKYYVNPCIPYNVGFKAAKGDVIIIQNPECRHEGDVLTYVAENIKEGVYISIPTYSADQDENDKFEKGEITYQQISCSLMNYHKWYNHPYHRPINFHFCCAILKSALVNKLDGGFDERYADGIGFDDTEFIRRIYRKGFTILAPEYPIVIHQWHDRGHWNNPNLETLNRNMYEREYLPGEKARLTEKTKPKHRVKNPMRVGASYNIFDGTELLRESILSIRDNVDHISIVYQTISNKGNVATEDTTDLMMDLVAEGLVDDVLYYNPDLKLKPGVNELNKRNIGYVNSYENLCTHHLSIDCDEFYDKQQFADAKIYIEQNDLDSSACMLYTYYKNNKTIIWPPEQYYVPFLYKIRKEFMYNFINWPVLVDPTRRIIPGNFYLFDELVLVMHHFSYVRNNLIDKLSNSSANINWTSEMIEKVLKHFEDWKQGEQALMAPGVYHDTKEVGPKFLLK